MLQAREITKWFGDVKVLDRINFTLNRGDRAGLIGPNGCGKTTLLRILAGQMAADRGSAQLMRSSLRVGYLPQALEFEADATVGDVLRAAYGAREAAEALGRIAIDQGDREPGTQRLQGADHAREATAHHQQIGP